MKLLAIETSSDIGSVALQLGESIKEQRIATPREQTERVLPIVSDLLSSAGLVLADLDGIAFGRGPGSFTGLRVAAAVAQGFGLAANLPLLPVSSLAAMAQGIWRTQGQERSLVCIDARMGEVFWGAYEIRGDLAELKREEHLSAPGAVGWTGTGSWGAVGSGFEAYAEMLAGVIEQAASVRVQWYPTAADLLPLARARLSSGNSVTPLEAAPVYLRDETAWRR